MKYLYSLMVLLASTASFAMPAKTDALIKALVKKDAFISFVENRQGFQSLSITRVINKFEPEVKAQCEHLKSRSAAVLKVSLGQNQMYFSTSENPEELEPCGLE